MNNNLFERNKYKFINDDKEYNETEPFENDLNLKENACHLCNVICKRKEHLNLNLKTTKMEIFKNKSMR